MRPALLSALVFLAVGLGLLWIRPAMIVDAPDPVETAVVAPQPVDETLIVPAIQDARPIAPEAFAAPEVSAADLIRQEARAPLSPLGAAPDPSQLPPRETVLHRPVALAAGLVEAQGHRIALAGIEALDPEESCEYEGRQWPCGAHARTAFRNYLRARALSCVVPATPGRETLTVTCSVASADPALWLAENGWVREGTADYADAIEAARAAGRGLFGPPPGG